MSLLKKPNCSIQKYFQAKKLENPVTLHSSNKQDTFLLWSGPSIPLLFMEANLISPFLLFCLNVLSDLPLACMHACVPSCFSHVWLFATPVGRRLPGSSGHRDSPGKNTGGGCRCLLQGIFLTQRSLPLAYLLTNMAIQMQRNFYWNIISHA